MPCLDLFSVPKDKSVDTSLIISVSINTGLSYLSALHCSVALQTDRSALWKTSVEEIKPGCFGIIPPHLRHKHMRRRSEELASSDQSFLELGGTKTAGSGNKTEIYSLITIKRTLGGGGGCNLSASPVSDVFN